MLLTQVLFEGYRFPHKGVSAKAPTACAGMTKDAGMTL